MGGGGGEERGFKLFIINRFLCMSMHIMNNLGIAYIVYLSVYNVHMYACSRLHIKQYEWKFDSISCHGTFKTIGYTPTVFRCMWLRGFSQGQLNVQ